MKILKTSEKTIALVQDIFEQGDSRYFDLRSATIVAIFLENKGIEIIKTFIKSYIQPSGDELNDIHPPQQYYKAIGKKWLEKSGYKVLDFELPFCGGIADILADHTVKNERVAVECCSCRTDKAIDYLEEKNTVLWVMSLKKTGLPEEDIPLFIIKRGPNWDECLKVYKDDLRRRLMSVKSPLDKL